MLVGAGLMFVLMHGEVEADGNKAKVTWVDYEPEPFVYSKKGRHRVDKFNSKFINIRHFQTKNLDCAVSGECRKNYKEIVCVKRRRFK